MWNLAFITAAKTLFQVADLKTLIFQIGDELENITKWSNVNKLQLNLVESKDCAIEYSANTA